MAPVGNAPKDKPGGIDVEHYYHKLVGGSMKSYHPGCTSLVMSGLSNWNSREGHTHRSAGC